MATSSLTKHYKVKDNESADRLIKIIESAPKKGTEKGNDKHTSVLEEGRELFKRVFAKVTIYNSKKASGWNIIPHYNNYSNQLYWG